MKPMASYDEFVSYTVQFSKPISGLEKHDSYESWMVMGSQLRWLERTPDKREVDGSIPFEPTIMYLENYIMKK